MGVDKALPSATRELLQLYPGAQIHKNNDRIQLIYGVPMTAGQNAAAAAETFVLLHSDAFGMGTIELAPDWAADTADGRHSVFSYREKIDGYPVEFGDVRVLVLNGATPRVVFAGGNMAPRPEGGFTPATVTSELAAAIAQSCKEGQGLDTWFGAPELVIFQGNGDWIAPVLTWKITGDSTKVPGGATLTFFIDAHTGQIVSTRSEVSHTDVGGSVTGKATPGVDPDIASNPPVVVNMPEIKVGVSGGNTAFTNRNGVFSIINPGTSAVTLNSSIGTAGGFGGQWVQVTANGAAGITATQAGVLPPGPGALVFNNAPVGVNSTTTAQVNAFVYVNVVHNYFKDLAPTYTRLDQVLRANTGVAGTCNANFSGASTATPCTTCNLNFFNAGGGCNNSAYANVIFHEYGHFIVNRLGRSQNSFGEGYGDVTAMLIQDDPIIGHNFFQTGAPVRTPMADNVQYPCTTTPSCGTEVHCCGELLGAIWYQTRLSMGAFHGSTPGLNLTRQMEVAWSLITTGGPSTFVAFGPANVIEMYTIDDNDGNLANGTPNYSRICAAITAHKGTMTAVQACPTITAVPCYSNCDGSTTPPILTANDFQCFLNAFASNQSYANCDNSTAAPTLTANDFQCFLNSFSAGCS